ncbi:TonB-dependent receptor [Thioclava sp. A2]|uniref:TonB-dependent receptor plug domain-containing protein n=1 Tax=Thioclava sp. FCG-A2 TaxID=3080562 RepID=UPI002952FB2F|nr:TonB-dependent receptor [Thioclava sp. A2]MDV7269721.1 TonB-dependent receptor [Thioclava sp. A2]
MKTLTAALLATTGLVMAAPAFAQEVYNLDEITVSANLEETAKARSGATVTVVTEQDLQEAGDTRVADYLSRIPGVSMASSGPIGTTGSLYVRGTPSQYVAVLVDGIDVGDAAAGQGSFDFGGLTTADISRIEVLKGSNAALYGSQAVAGVINITTKRAKDIGTEQSVAAELGSYRTRKLSYSLATKTETGEVALTYSHMMTDGFSAADENDGNFEADGYRANRLSFYGEHSIAPGVTLGLTGFVEDSRGAFDESAYDSVKGSYVPVDGTTGDDYTIRDSNGLRAFADISAGGIDHKIELSRYQMNRDSCSNGWCDDFHSTRGKLRYQGATDLGANGRLVFGAETEREKAHGASTQLNSLFSELTYAITPQFDVTASARYDHHSDFGAFNSGRLAAVYRFSDDLLVRASAGNGFRAPSLYELYGPYGDTSLAPEESKTADLGIEKSFGDKGSISATAFWLEATNLIGWNRSSGSYGQISGKSRRSGLELAGSYALSQRIELGGNYTYTDSSVSTGWSAVERHNLSVYAKAQMSDDVSGMLSVQYVADRPDALREFAVANAMLTYAIDADKEAYLRVENLFDTEYQLNDSYGTSDRAFYVGVRASF